MSQVCACVTKGARINLTHIASQHEKLSALICASLAQM